MRVREREERKRENTVILNMGHNGIGIIVIVSYL